MPTAHDPHPASQLRSLHDRSALHAEHRLAGAVVAPVSSCAEPRPRPETSRSAGSRARPVISRPRSRRGPSPRRRTCRRSGSGSGPCGRIFPARLRSSESPPECYSWARHPDRGCKLKIAFFSKNVTLRYNPQEKLNELLDDALDLIATDIHGRWLDEVERIERDLAEALDLREELIEAHGNAPSAQELRMLDKILGCEHVPGSLEDIQARLVEVSVDIDANKGDYPTE